PLGRGRMPVGPAFRQTPTGATDHRPVRELDPRARPGADPRLRVLRRALPRGPAGLPAPLDLRAPGRPNDRELEEEDEPAGRAAARGEVRLEAAGGGLRPGRLPAAAGDVPAGAAPPPGGPLGSVCLPHPPVRLLARPPGLLDAPAAPEWSSEKGAGA